MMPRQSETYAVQVETTVAAPRKAVFRAWTTRSQLEQWMQAADDWRPTTVSVDARVGGAYRFELHPPGGNVYIESGTFRELQAPARLVYTCRFEGPNVLEPDMLVTVDLRDLAGRTHVSVVQEGYQRLENRDAQQEGWPLFLAQLEKLLVACRDEGGR